MFPRASLPVRVLGPTVDPVTLQEAKSHLRVTHAADDTLINLLIDAATSYLDAPNGICGRALITQTWKQNFTDFAGGIRLSIGPVASISSVKYYDTASTPVQQTLSSSVYELRRDDISDFVALKWNQTWPNYTPRWDAIEITWIAGEAANAIPPAIKQAMLLLIGHFYENREHVVVGAQPFDIPMGLHGVLDTFRKPRPFTDCFLERERNYPWV